MDPYSLVMVPASIESTRYRFGEFELSPDQGELLESGRRVRIQPQPLRVLSILVAHAGNLVRRDELFAQVWGEDTHVDFDRGLNYCIKQIRTALGDDASEPRFVGTVPRFGYRFVAEVEVLGPAQAPSKAPLATGSRHGATIVAAVVACLLVLVSVGMAWRFAPAQTAPHRADPEALREFLRGRHLIDSGSVEDALEGLEHLENAVILDPEFARGHLALARGLVRVPGDREQTLSRARSAAQRSVQLDPGMAEAHAFLGSLSLFGEWDFETAELAYRRALDLEPSNATLRHEYASLLAIMGQHESALLQIGRAMELDPVSTSIKADAGWFYYQARRFDEAEKLCQVTLTIDPRNENALWCLLQTYRLSGREREALDAAKRLAALLDPAVSALSDLETFWRWHLSWLSQHPGAGSPSTAGLDHLALGEEEQALEVFEQALADHSSCVLLLVFDPQVDRLRGHPRFDRLLEELGTRSGSGS